MRNDPKRFPIPSIPRRCAKIQLPGEISFSRCPEDGKIHAGKIGGTGMIPNGYPPLREGTPATWNKTM